MEREMTIAKNGTVAALFGFLVLHSDGYCGAAAADVPSSSARSSSSLSSSSGSWYGSSHGGYYGSGSSSRYQSSPGLDAWRERDGLNSGLLPDLEPDESLWNPLANSPDARAIGECVNCFEEIREGSWYKPGGKVRFPRDINESTGMECYNCSEWAQNRIGEWWNSYHRDPQPTYQLPDQNSGFEEPYIGGPYMPFVAPDFSDDSDYGTVEDWDGYGW
jgi:hypothetical protein